MIKFYKHDHCQFCDAAEEKLTEIVLAHKTFECSEARKLCLTDATIIEGEKVISGHPAITAFLEEISKVMELWQKFQSDACYMDDNGEIC